MLSVRGPAYPLSVCWCAAAGALFVVARRRPWQPLWRCSWCRVPCARWLLLLPALPGGRGKFLRRASPSWAGAPVGCHRWLGCGGPPGGCFPALPLNSPAHRRSRSTRPATPATALRGLPRKKNYPGNPCRPAQPLLPVPCAVGFVQNPSSACPTTRPQSQTKHYGVSQDLTRYAQQMSATLCVNLTAAAQLRARRHSPLLTGPLALQRPLRFRIGLVPGGAVQSLLAGALVARCTWRIRGSGWRVSVP